MVTGGSSRILPHSQSHSSRLQSTSFSQQHNNLLNLQTSDSNQPKVGKLVVPIPVHVNRITIRSQHQQLEKNLTGVTSNSFAISHPRIQPTMTDLTLSSTSPFRSTSFFRSLPQRNSHPVCTERSKSTI